MKRGLGGDIVIFALLLSAGAHLGVMFYAEPKVMIHVVPESVRAHRRGPVRITEPVQREIPAGVNVLEDVTAEKAAPEAPDTSALSVPAPADGATPPDASAAALVPSALPQLPDVPLAIEAPPPVMTSDAAPAAKASPPDASAYAASAVPRLRPAPSAVAPSALVAGGGVPLVAPPPAPEVSVPDLTPPEATAEITSKPPEDAAQEFKPVAEVMEKISEEVVKKEKAAVKALVDVPDAGELAKFVGLDVAKAVEGGYTYFRVKISPKAGLAPVPKDLVVLIDASGSIGDDRMGSIKLATRKILRSALNTGDRFNLVAFRDRFSYAFKSWRNCTTDSFAAAEKWLAKEASYGRTDVFASIASVLALPRDPARPLVALVVTDGEANTGVSETADIISRFSRLNDGLVSVYMYGVKKSANRELIDVLTRGNRGDSVIFDGWWWKAGSELGTLAERFRDPVLSDMRVVFASGCPAEAYPRLLKNLSRGGTVELVGRVPAGVREVSFSLKGLNGRKAYESFFRLPLDSAAADPALAAAWRTEREIDLKLR